MASTPVDSDLIVFSGRANPVLAGAICRHLGVDLGRATVGNFPDGEVSIKIEQDVRGRDVFIVQPTCPPVNDNLVELLVFIDCARRASAQRVTAVVPYFGYARQDRKDEGRVPISAKLVANAITVAGADRVLTVDLHAAQVQGFFDIPVDHLYAAPVLRGYFKSLDLQNLVVVASDVGRMASARGYADRLGCSFAAVDKRRVSAKQVEAVNVIGEVEGHTALLVDDVITTAGTISEAARILRERGATRVIAGATHPIFCGEALRRLRASPIEFAVVTDSIPLRPEVLASGLDIRILSVADLLGEAILRIHMNRSVSALFDATEEDMARV
jgi:ribose-phosphate pyrophosphokinase